MGRKEGTGKEGIKGGYRLENRRSVRGRKGREEKRRNKELRCWCEKQVRKEIRKEG